MRNRRVQRILDSVPWHCEAPHVRTAMNRLAVWTIAEWMIVGPVRLIVNHAPPVLATHVAQPVIEIRKRIGPLTVTIWQRFTSFLLTSVQIWIPEPMTRKDANH